MKAMQKAALEVETDNLSVPEAEEMIEEALEELAYSNDPALARALQFLAPAGYQAIVELCSENGRSKRRNELASCWAPEDDEIRIYFEPLEDDADQHEDADEPVARPAAIRPGRQFARAEGRIAAPRPRAVRAPFETLDDNHGNTLEGNGALPADIDDRIRELCSALSEAERGGHAFIALKWFRDSFLPRKPLNWNQTPESRQMVLAEAILRGVVLTSKIPNPKTPAYPTTTIRLNRAEDGIPEEAQRFRPVAVQGEALTATLDDSRGNL